VQVLVRGLNTTVIYLEVLTGKNRSQLPLCKSLSSNIGVTSLHTESYTCKWAKRAQEVLALLKGRVALEGKTILDLGCGPAPISEGFRHLSPFLVGLDRDKRYLRKAKESASLELVLGDGTSLPFKNQGFEFVLCNDVLEHVRDHAKLTQELFRILARGGATYVQCANKYQIIEPHFLLPFLSWVPGPLADIYIKVTRRGESYKGYFPMTRRSVFALTGTYRTVDLTYERTLMKIKNLSIQSNSLQKVVSMARRILSDELIAKLSQNFSIISILVLKD